MADRLRASVSCLCIFPMLLQGETHCEWMNGGTAAGIIGGPVTEKSTPSTCEFAHMNDILRIEVTKSTAPSISFRSLAARCKSPMVSLKAIGNESILCVSEADEEMAVGRVRDQIFVIRLKTSEAKDQAKEKLTRAAEQVAGNLF